MSPPAYPHLFKPLKIRGIRLKNRLTMAPLYLGYAQPGGKISPLLLSHYQLMAGSGVALVVVENASIDPSGSGSPRTIRCDHDRYLPGLSQLAEVINEQKCRSALQIIHAGRFAAAVEPVSASDVPAFGRTPRPLTKKEITAIQKKYARAALRVKQAGFDLVELHGGTGYLLPQFVSPRTNRRDDEYGGSIENRMRFVLETVRRMKDAVGDYPVAREPLPADNPLWATPSTWITPHNAGTSYAPDIVLRIFCDNYRRFAQGRELKYLVDLDSVHPEIGQFGRDQGMRKILPQACG